MKERSLCLVSSHYLWAGNYVKPKHNLILHYSAAAMMLHKVLTKLRLQR